jgi:N-acetylglucosaminyldiphosphoundecaprenol N-acetyl-beta-D-mannosaminyltransferase
MSERVELFGIGIDPLTMDQAVNHMLTWIRDDRASCRFVVTPNVDHIVKLQRDAAFKAAYLDAAMVVVDGKPVLAASRLLGRPLPETVPGSDLAPALFAASGGQPSLKVFLFGAADGVAVRAAQSIEKKWPWIRVCGTYSPPMGFSPQAASSATAIDLINSSGADVLVIGLGAPKQEIWIASVRSRLRVKVALCIGASIDFMAGEKKRAPPWMRRMGIEWIHRALSEPRRLIPRYAHDAWVFPRLLVKEWFNR